MRCSRRDATQRDPKRVSGSTREETHPLFLKLALFLPSVRTAHHRPKLSICKGPGAPPARLRPSEPGLLPSARPFLAPRRLAPARCCVWLRSGFKHWVASAAEGQLRNRTVKEGGNAFPPSVLFTVRGPRSGAAAGIEAARERRAGWAAGLRDAVSPDAEQAGRSGRPLRCHSHPKVLRPQEVTTEPP